MIAILDYGSGNVAAIADIFKRLKIPHLITRDYAELRSADRYVLPGVGAFDTTMRTLRNSGLVSLLNEEVFTKGKSILAACWPSILTRQSWPWRGNLVHRPVTSERAKTR